MSKSIMTDVKRCYFCDSPNNLQKHHCLHGTANRKLAEEDGAWVWLCADHHTLSPMSVHRNAKMDLFLKRVCQARWEDVYGSRDDFIKRYGKSWITEEDDEIQN